MSRSDPVYTLNLYDKSGTKKICSSSGKVNTQIRVLKLFEVVNKFPVYYLEAYGSDFDKFLGEVDFVLEFKSDVSPFKAKVCVVYKELQPDVNKIILHGYVCEYVLFDKVNTVFLGSSTKDAISALGFEQKLVLKKNLQIDYHQVNATAVEKLLDICKCEADFPYWSVGVSKILLSKETKKQKFVTLDKVTSFFENSCSEIIESEENYDDDFYGASYHRINMLGHIDNYESLPSLCKNIYLSTFKKPYRVITGEYNNVYPYELGALVENAFKFIKDIDYWVVTSLVTIYRDNKVSSEIQYSSWKEDL